jgi:hypothetical protein
MPGSVISTDRPCRRLRIQIPPESEIGHRCAHPSRQMRMPFTPVETGPAKRRPGAGVHDMDTSIVVELKPANHRSKVALAGEDANRWRQL